MNIDDIKIGSSEHALALADSLEGLEEASLGPSDIELCVKALRGHASGRRIRDIGKISADGEITVDVLERYLDQLAIVMGRAPPGRRGLSADLGTARSRDRGAKGKRVHDGSRAAALSDD